MRFEAQQRDRYTPHSPGRGFSPSKLGKSHHHQENSRGQKRASPHHSSALGSLGGLLLVLALLGSWNLTTEAYGNWLPDRVHRRDDRERPPDYFAAERSRDTSREPLSVTEKHRTGQDSTQHPSIKANGESLVFFMAVASGRYNFERRQRSRRWLKQSSYPYKFFVGLPPPESCATSMKWACEQFADASRQRGGTDNREVLLKDCMSRYLKGCHERNAASERTLAHEKRQHGDVVELDIVDTYYNLTAKTVESAFWAYSGSITPTFFAKIDDDLSNQIVEAIPRLVGMLANTRGPSKVNSAANIRVDYGGCLNPRIKAIRDSTHRWFVPKEAFRGDYYPTYARGDFYVLSDTAARRIANLHSPTADERAEQLLWGIEDVYTAQVLQRTGTGGDAEPIFPSMEVHEHMWSNGMCA